MISHLMIIWTRLDPLRFRAARLASNLDGYMAPKTTLASPPEKTTTKSLLGSDRPTYQFWVKNVLPSDVDVTLRVLAPFPF